MKKDLARDLRRALNIALTLFRATAAVAIYMEPDGSIYVLPTFPVDRAMGVAQSQNGEVQLRLAAYASPVPADNLLTLVKVWTAYLFSNGWSHIFLEGGFAKSKNGVSRGVLLEAERWHSSEGKGQRFVFVSPLDAPGEMAINWVDEGSNKTYRFATFFPVGDGRYRVVLTDDLYGSLEFAGDIPAVVKAIFAWGKAHPRVPISLN